MYMWITNMHSLYMRTNIHPLSICKHINENKYACTVNENTHASTLYTYIYVYIYIYGKQICSTRYIFICMDNKYASTIHKNKYTCTLYMYVYKWEQTCTHCKWENKHASIHIYIHGHQNLSTLCVWI